MDRARSLLGILLEGIMADAEPPEPLIHIPEDAHDALAQETAEFVRRRIRELNPGANENVCDECVMNVGAMISIDALARLEEAKTSELLLVRIMTKQVKKFEAVAHMFMRGQSFAEIYKIATRLKE